jgi:RsiW-degrading membrane proteinase PrsW (M82 family)
MGWGVIALAFAGVWVYAFHREDVHDREPVWMLGVALLGGAASMALALWLEDRLLPHGPDLDGTLIERWKAVFLVAGPVEEICKFAAVWLLVWPRAHFNEPMDGIVYAVAAATGFATAENFWFMHGQPSVILSRGPIAVAIHILFAAFWGGAMGHARGLPNRSRRFLIITLGVAMASFVHGAFDAIVFSVGHEISLGQARTLQILLVTACFAFLRWRMKVALSQSPFRKLPGGLEP